MGRFEGTAPLRNSHMDKLDDYLLLTYLVPMVAITWAMADIKSLLIVTQLVSLGYLVYGAVEVVGVIQDAGEELSASAQQRMFLTGLLGYFLPVSSVLLGTVCLQQVMANAQEGSKP